MLRYKQTFYSISKAMEILLSCFFVLFFLPIIKKPKVYFCRFKFVRCKIRIFLAYLFQFYQNERYILFLFFSIPFRHLYSARYRNYSINHIFRIARLQQMEEKLEHIGWFSVVVVHFSQNFSTRWKQEFNSSHVTLSSCFRHTRILHHQPHS